MWHISLSESFYNLPKNSVGFLAECASLEHVAVHFFQIDLNRVVELIEVFHGDGDAVAVEHLEDLIAGESSGAVEVEVAEDLFDGGFFDELLWEIEVAVVFAVLVAVAGSQPLDEACLRQLRTHLALLLPLLHHKSIHTDILYQNTHPNKKATPPSLKSSL